VPYGFKIRVVENLMEIAFIPGVVVVHTNDLVPLGKQPIAKV
jgi:hypothetical protein